jgi:hypothetical protein
MTNEKFEWPVTYSFITIFKHFYFVGFESGAVWKLRYSDEIKHVIIISNRGLKDQHAKYEFATLNTCSIASNVAYIKWKISFRSSVKGASFYTKYVSNANVIWIVLIVVNSYLALRFVYCYLCLIISNMTVRFIPNLKSSAHQTLGAIGMRAHASCSKINSLNYVTPSAE